MKNTNKIIKILDDYLHIRVATRVAQQINSLYQGEVGSEEIKSLLKRILDLRNLFEYSDDVSEEYIGEAQAVRNMIVDVETMYQSMILSHTQTSEERCTCGGYPDCICDITRSRKQVSEEGKGEIEELEAEELASFTKMKEAHRKAVIKRAKNRCDCCGKVYDGKDMLCDDCLSHDPGDGINND